MNTLIQTLKNGILVAVALVSLASTSQAADPRAVVTAMVSGSPAVRVVPATARRVPAVLTAAGLRTLPARSARRPARPVATIAGEAAPAPEFAGKEMLGFFGRVLDMVNEKDTTVRLSGVSLVAY